MTCDEFEAIGLNSAGDVPLTDAQRAEAAAHVASCARCAALRGSWEAAREEIRCLAQATADADTPARVEMRLRQQFRTQYHTPKVRRMAAVSAWALAAAAVLVGAVSWVKWRESVEPTVSVKSSTSVSNPGSSKQSSTTDSQTLLADNELSGFILLPGVLPADTDDAAIFQVRMQRGALGTLGLPVNEDRAGEWIQVDLLVGDDGLPQAVRIPESLQEE